jgi:CRP/FNR family transcriptional regulator
VEALARVATVKDVPRGTLLANEGDVADSFGVVVEGRVRVFYLGPDGKQVTFETVESGQPIAAVAALAGTRYPATVESATPATIAWLPREALFELMEREPAVARNIVANLANRVVNFTSVVQTLSMDVPSRVARYVFQRALSQGRPDTRGIQLDLGMPKGELALALGTVPETLSRAFHKLRDDGVMDVEGRSVTVLDMRALAALAGGFGEG